MNHYFTPATSHYTKLIKTKMFYKGIPKLNSQCASNQAIGHLINHDGMYVFRLLLQH
jgi:hypothetical protein